MFTLMVDIKLEIIRAAVVSFNPDSFFDMKALNFLEKAGIPVMSTYTQYIQNILGLPMTHDQESDLINYCIRSVWQVSPTWNNLLHILRVLKLDDLAQKIESYLSGATENLSPIRRTDGEETTLRLYCMCCLQRKNFHFC